MRGDKTYGCKSQIPAREFVSGPGRDLDLDIWFIKIWNFTFTDTYKVSSESIAIRVLGFPTKVEIVENGNKLEPEYKQIYKII